MPRNTSAQIDLARAAEVARTGDIWLFRGHSSADRAIRMVTNAPVNHVAMVVALDDLPPLLWHAELGKKLHDYWSGDRHRGVQLHDLVEAVTQWTTVYGQQAWFRQLSPAVQPEQEDALLRTIARWDGTTFPTTSTLAWRWLRGRHTASELDIRALGGRRGRAAQERVEQVYCAEVVAATMEAMGILEGGRPWNWYDPGRFWSGDRLPLTPGWVLGDEIPVESPGSSRRTPATRR